MEGRALGALLSPPERQEGEREAPALALVPPPRLDVTAVLPSVWDQGPEGSCTGHALAALAAFHWPSWLPSRRDPYWQARHLLGMLGGPDGAHMAAVLKAGQRWGYLGEDAALYVPGNREWCPPEGADEMRKYHHIKTYWRPEKTLPAMQAALWSSGPVAVVVETDDAFNWPTAGRIEAPKGKVHGLHAVALVGYDVGQESFLLRNSWGVGWGTQGHAWVSWLWLAVRLKEAWQISRGDGNPSPRPLWEMLFPELFLQASRPPDAALA